MKRLVLILALCAAPALAQPAATNLNSTLLDSGTDLSSYTSASVSPAANRYLVVFYEAVRVTSDPSTPTVSTTLSGVTFTLCAGPVTINTGGANNRKMWAHCADTGAAPGTGTITWDHSGETQTAAMAHGAVFTGYEASCPTGNTNTAAALAATALTVGLASVQDSGSSIVVAIGKNTTSSVTPEVGWSELDTENIATPSSSLEMAWISGTANLGNDYTWTGSADSAGLAVEVMAACPAASGKNRSRIIN